MDVNIGDPKEALETLTSLQRDILWLGTQRASGGDDHADFVQGLIHQITKKSVTE